MSHERYIVAVAQGQLQQLVKHGSPNNVERRRLGQLAEAGLRIGLHTLADRNHVDVARSLRIGGQHVGEANLARRTERRRKRGVA